MITDVPSDRPDTVVKEVWIDAPPAAVYEYFTDRDKLLQWIGVAATVEPHVGGAFSFDANNREVMSGAFVELVPHTRIVFTWGWRGGTVLPPGASTVEITLAPDRGGTRLCLVHRGLGGEVIDKHRFGWGHYLARLAARAQGTDPGADKFATNDTNHAA